jgi:hypothetical protein
MQFFECKESFSKRTYVSELDQISAKIFVQKVTKNKKRVLLFLNWIWY